jgi:hypothetical protein
LNFHHQLLTDNSAAEEKQKHQKKKRKKKEEREKNLVGSRERKNYRLAESEQLLTCWLRLVAVNTECT